MYISLKVVIILSSLGNKQVMADNIIRYMNMHKKTRNDLCNDLGFKYTTVTGWLTAEKYPRIDKIEIMANYFGINKSDLIEEKPPEISEGSLKQEAIAIIRNLPESKIPMAIELLRVAESQAKKEEK